MKRFLLLIAFSLPGCVPALLEAAQDTREAPSPTARLEPTEQPSTSTPFPAGPISLVALGDSHTLGEGEEAGNGYPGRMLQVISEFRPGSSMLNLGQAGWTSDALIEGDRGIESQLDRAIIELEHAKSQGRGAIALVWIGTNDLWYLYEYSEGSDEGDLADLNHFLHNMTTILSRLHDTGAVVAVALLDDQSKRPIAVRGETFTGITDEELTRMSAQVDQYNTIIAVKAAQYGAILVEFYNTDIFTSPAALTPDGDHLNRVGYGLIAEKWLDALARIVLQ